MSDEKDQAAPKKRDVLKELMGRAEELTRALKTDAEFPAVPNDDENMRRMTEVGVVIATCAVHALGILAEIATYQRVIAETSTITLQMKQMQGASGGLASMSPGGLVIPRG